MSYKTAVVIGGGAFGSAIAFVLAQNFSRVLILVRSQNICEEINSGTNTTYLPGHKLPSNIKAVQSWEEIKSLTVDEVQLIVSGLPMSALDEFMGTHKEEIIKYFERDVVLVNLAKGIDPDTLALPDEMYLKHFGPFQDQLMYLSGPSFAQEILEKQVTLVSLAGTHKEKLLRVCEMFNTFFFKCLPTTDVKGVLLGGSLKNVIAIAGGIIEGLGYNHNTRAALITRGIVEMLRFGAFFNARPETFYGPSGMGDLILTTTGGLSRNKSFGLEMAKGKKASEVLANTKSVVEGYKTTKAAYFLAERENINARIFKGLYQVLYLDQDPREVIKEMMKLPSKFDEPI